MLWLGLALLTALSTSLVEVFSKQGLEELDEYVISWTSGLAVFLLLPALFWTGLPEPSLKLGIVWFASGGLNVLALVMYIKAIKYAPLSIVAPLKTLTPALLLLTSPILVQEVAPLLGIIGVGLIVVGVYVLQAPRKGESWLAPLKALWHNRGARLMLGVNLVWSIVANVDAMGTRMTDPWTWSVLSRGGILAGTSLLLVFRTRVHKQLQELGQHKAVLLPLLLCWALASVTQMAAMDLTLVSYVIAVKRTSAVMSVFFGAYLFKEKSLGKRLIGAVLAVAGVVVLSLG